MNELTEQVVKKQKDARYYINVLLIVLAAIAIPATLIVFAYITGPAYLVYLALFAAMFCIYGVWFFVTSLRIEYEYAFLLSTLRIDKIIAKRRRKLIVKVDVKTLDDFFPYSDEEMSAHKFTKIYRACNNEFDKANYVASFHNEAKGRCAIIFAPNEEFVAAMKPYFNTGLRKKLFKENRL